MGGTYWTRASYRDDVVMREVGGSYAHVGGEGRTVQDAEAKAIAAYWRARRMGKACPADVHAECLAVLGDAKMATQEARADYVYDRPTWVAKRAAGLADYQGRFGF